MNTAIALAALTALATTAGGILAIRVRDRLHLILGLSAGLLLGLVAFDLLPEIFEMNTSTLARVPVVSIALVTGFLALHFAEQIFGSHERVQTHATRRRENWSHHGLSISVKFGQRSNC